ncbi:MAG: DUF4173 domain-containing protein [Actinomycetia bacterium]|nr:DUF4173 domain-containing protein [Actinomycetes bacterium]
MSSAWRWASYLTTPFVLGNGFSHVVIIGIGLTGAASIVAENARTDGPTVTAHRGVLEAPEQIALLGGSALVYAGFLAAQLAAVLGGADHVLEAAGLTWAEYARSGFFQLLWAVVLTLGILMGTRSFGTELSALARRLTTILALALVAFTIAVVAISIRRLDLYEVAFGPSMLRLYSTVFAGWLGLVFALAGLDRIGRGLRGRLVAAVAASALATLVAMNLYNPEHQVASGHLAQFDGIEVDDRYLSVELGADALPALLADPDTRDLGCMVEVDNPGWLSWNLGRVRAAEAQAEFCS